VRYLRLIQIANQAKATEDADGQHLVNIIFVYLLWFLFDNVLEDEDESVDWHGEVCFVPDSQNELASKLCLRLIKFNNQRNKSHQVDCVSIQATSCSIYTLIKVLAQRKLPTLKLRAPQPVVEEEKKSLDTLWQDLFKSRGSFFCDLDEAEDIHRMIGEILSPTAAENCLVALKYHLQFSSS